MNIRYIINMIYQIIKYGFYGFLISNILFIIRLITASSSTIKSNLMFYSVYEFPLLIGLGILIGFIKGIFYSEPEEKLDIEDIKNIVEETVNYVIVGAIYGFAFPVTLLLILDFIGYEYRFYIIHIYMILGATILGALIGFKKGRLITEIIKPGYTKYSLFRQS